jgi:outer membrane protein
MKRYFALFLIGAGMPLSSLRADDTAPTSLTLNQAVELAISQSESLKISAENKELAAARRKQALGSILPDVHWLWTHLWQARGTGNASLTSTQRTDSRFTAEQPLFEGLKEFASMSAFKAQARQAEAQLKYDTVTLTLNVAESFYQVVQLETYGRDLDVLGQLTADRVKELNGRIRLGKSRTSEIVSAESQLATLNASKESNAGSLIAARDELGFWVGRDLRAAVILDSVTVSSPLADEMHYVSLAAKRSDIAALQENVEYYRYGVRVAQSGHYPFLNLVGNYYTQRTGLQSGIDWDMSLNLDVPIFQGGLVSAQVREARSLLRQAQLQLDRQKRFAVSEISQAYAMLISSQRQERAYSEAAKKAKASFEAQGRDYRLGLVDNLQVLESMNAMQSAVSSYDTAVVQSKLNYLKLQCVTEEFQ